MTKTDLTRSPGHSGSVDNLSVVSDEKRDLNLVDEIHELLAKLGESRIEPVAYDTAWVARLGDIDSQLSTNALEWLRANQLPDGSWGAAEPLYHHDRVISTLATLIALKRNNAPVDEPRIRAALPALQESLAKLHDDIAGRTIAFETLLPTLVAEAEALGIEIHDPDGIVGSMSRLRDAKLAHAPKGLIGRHTTLGFSAEMVGLDGLHLLDLDDLQQEDGSVSVSPAATAFFATYVRPDAAALQYLRRVVIDGGAPALTAIDIFERAWPLWNFTRGREIDPLIVPYKDALLDQLELMWHHDQGIAHASTFAVPDGDDTGLVYELLAQFGRAPDAAALWYYEEEDHFRCFDLESHESVSTNVHILGALLQAGYDTDHRAVQKIVAFLRREEYPEGFWVDKWHASPYYPTSHAIAVCAGHLNQLVSGAVDWLSQTQNSDGSWGYFSPTAEETANCLQALMIWRQEGLPIQQEVLESGIAWLARNSEPPYPPLWISKTLKCPTLVVRSAILAALRQYECEFGTLP